MSDNFNKEMNKNRDLIIDSVFVFSNECIKKMNHELIFLDDFKKSIFNNGIISFNYQKIDDLFMEAIRMKFLILKNELTNKLIIVYEDFYNAISRMNKQSLSNEKLNEYSMVLNRKCQRIINDSLDKKIFDSEFVNEITRRLGLNHDGNICSTLNECLRMMESNLSRKVEVDKDELLKSLNKLGNNQNLINDNNVDMRKINEVYVAFSNGVINEELRYERTNFRNYKFIENITKKVGINVDSDTNTENLSAVNKLNKELNNKLEILIDDIKVLYSFLNNIDLNKQNTNDQINIKIQEFDKVTKQHINEVSIIKELIDFNNEINVSNKMSAATMDDLNNSFKAEMLLMIQDAPQKVMNNIITINNVKNNTINVSKKMDLKDNKDIYDFMKINYKVLKQELVSEDVVEFK